MSGSGDRFASVDYDERFGGDRAALGMVGPGGETAHRGGATAAGDDGGLEFVGAPALNRRRDGVALASAAERGERGGAVTGGVGVQSNPAVGGGIIAGNRVPHRRQGPAFGSQRVAEPQRSEATVDNDVWRTRRLRGHAFRDRQRSRGD